MSSKFMRAQFACFALLAAPLIQAEEQASTMNSAKVEVLNVPAIPLVEGENWRKAPDFLAHATIFFSRELPSSVLNFSVTEPGLVVLAASFSYDGNQIDEPWTDDCQTFEDLKKDGWTIIGVLNSPITSRHYLFRKVMKAGEKYQLQTRLRFPPYVILVPDADAAAVMAVKPWIGPERKTPMILAPETSEPKGQSPDASPQVVSLRFHEPVQSLLYMRFGVLLREIVQQGLSLAASEQLGLPTRDTSLRDTLPQDAQPGVGQLRVVTVAQPLNSIDMAIYQQQGKPWEALWDEELRLPPKDLYENLTSLVEKWSRTDFVDVLHRAGYQGTPLPAARDTAALPEGADKLLNELTMPAQFDAVRTLHAEIRKNGESPELLGALARGYVMLGVLTEDLWNTAHKAFKARALLFAERAVQAWPKSAQALENRAYVRALIGLHRTALDDLKAAAELRNGADKSNSEPDAASWTKSLDAFCKFDADALEAAAQPESDKAFVRLLQLLSAEYSQSEREIMNASGELLTVSPGCLRAIDGGMKVHQLGFHRQLLDYGTKLTEQVLLGQVAKAPDLPAETTKLIADFQKASRISGLARLLGATPPDEMQVRLKVIAALREAGKPENDSQEPSWQLLAQLLEEIDFIQAWWQVDVAANWLGWDPDATIDALAPQIDHHPYAPYVRSFTTDPPKMYAELQKIVDTVDVATMQLSEVDIASRETRVHPEWVQAHWSIGYCMEDLVAPDLCALLKNAKYPQVVAFQLQDASPYLPFGVATAIEQGTGSARGNAAELEKQYAKSAVVQAALGKYYYEANKMDDAIRCYKQAIEDEPTYANYYWLAAIYERLKDEEKWLETLEEFLKTAGYGLDHAQVQVQIAEHFMTKRDWKKARGYAEEAAQTWAAWAMLCAAQCAEALQDWPSAEQWYKNVSERYATLAAEWYCFCRRTGQGDQQKALELAMNLVRTNEKRNSIYELMLAAAIHELVGQTKEALADLDRAFEADHGCQAAVAAALMHEDLGETELRDKILNKVHELRDRYPKEAEPVAYVGFCETMRTEVASGKSGKVDLETLDKFAITLPLDRRGNYRYYIGRYLNQRGEADKAIEYWTAVMNSNHMHGLWRTLAGAALWDRGITPTSYKEMLLKPPEEPDAPKDHSN